jgi:ribosomal protein L14E/L6E/L27E
VSEEIVLGQIVHSKAGRDKDRYFIVIDILNNDYVLISDGYLRRVEKPKRKKIKHLVVHDMIADDIKSKLEKNIRVNNGDIRNSLKLLGMNNQSNNKEV